MVYFLKGNARVIYAKLSDEDACSYDTLKSALYEGFQLTAEEYRKKFRHTNKVSTDSYKEHIVKLERYLANWVDRELSKCKDNVKALKDLMLRE